MEILLLTQYFTPEPTGKLADLARELKTRGHQVQVLTGFPCYPHGRIYDGYRQALWQAEEIDGNKIIRVPQLPDHSRSVVKRILYYGSFALSAILIGILKVKRPNVVLVYQSAMPTGLAAWVLSRLWRVPYVIDLADLWPESVAASGMLRNRRLQQFIRRLAQFVYEGAAEINVITEGYCNNLLQIGITSDKLNLVRWWPEPGVFEPTEPDESFALQEAFAGKFNVLYAGTIGPCQQLETVVTAAELLTDCPDVQFTIAGEGVARADLEQVVQHKRLMNVRFIGRRTPEDVNRMFALSDLLLVHLKADEMSEISIPSKTVDYLSSGRPLLMAVAGEASRLVLEHGCGISVSPSDPQQLADAVRQFRGLPKCAREKMANAARLVYLGHFRREDQIDKMEASLLRAVGRRRGTSFYHCHGKRLFDLLFALSSLVALAPLFLLTAIAVRVMLGGPALFKQHRPGLNGRLFTMYKFRTMRDLYDAAGSTLPDADRLTSFGGWLRALSLDELPGLWNVLRGEMSLVGPRPLLPAYLSRYTEEQARRHDVKPGLTGLAQISGRNALTWEEKFKRDLEYVENYTFWMDLSILGRTVAKVIEGSDVSAGDHATMPEFLGSGNLEEEDGRHAA